MSIRKRLAQLLVFAVLQCGALSGAITPEEIEKWMSLASRTKIVQVVKKDDPPGK